MRPRSGHTNPIWGPDGIAGRGEPLPETRTPVDVVVIGAGIAGITTAYLLAQRGQRVIVVDEGPIGGAETGRSSGHLASAIDEHFVELEEMHGAERAKLAYRSHAAAIDRIEQIVRDEGIDCGLVRVPAYLLGAGPHVREQLEREVEAARRAGLIASLVEDAPRGGFVCGPSVRYEHQARFHPTEYLAGLAAAARRAGVRIHGDCRIASVHARGEHGESAQAIPDDGRPPLRANAIVVATNTPGPVIAWAGIYFKQAAYRTYVIALRIDRGIVEDALYWDTVDPYHYVRLLGDPSGVHDVLIVGGEDHRTGQLGDGAAPFGRLERWARASFPAARELLWRWSGQIQEPFDGLAFIGRAPIDGDGIYVITGDSGNGLTHATLGAELVTDLVLGRTNPWRELYDPRRKPLHSLGAYARENIGTATHLLGALTPGDTDAPSKIAPGCGAVVREGLRKLAVYRDESGTLHACSAVCPHLKAIVAWNPIERTWDCPAHGSRFSALGELLVGPATSDLDGVDDGRVHDSHEDVGDAAR